MSNVITLGHHCPVCGEPTDASGLGGFCSRYCWKDSLVAIWAEEDAQAAGEPEQESAVVLPFKRS